MDNSLEIPPEVRSFLEGLLNDSGMVTLDEKTREVMVRELFVRLDNFITATIVNHLAPEDLSEFIKLNEEKKPKAEVEQYLKDHVQNSQEVFVQAFAEFRNMYLGQKAPAKSDLAPAE